MKLKNSYDYFYLLFNELIRVKIRTGRLEKEMTDEAAIYTSSLEFDRFIFDADIQCNYAHTSMLKAQGIIDEEIADKILEALDKLSDEGFDALEFDHSVEDVHMAVENYVTKLVGPEAGFMHTAKSRNDQVATDIRLLLRDRISEIQIGILEFIEGILELAKEHKETVMIGYTHLQHAQPVTLAHHLMAHAQALKRDYQRLDDTYKRVNLNPLGSAAMATTSFPIDRELTTQLLGFDDVEILHEDKDKDTDTTTDPTAGLDDTLDALQDDFSFTESPIEESINAFVEKFKEAWFIMN
jgi:argininosuccinate lyase